MSVLGQELSENSETIVDRWYRHWKESSHPHPEIDEIDLRDSLASQIRIIGAELNRGAKAQAPERMWNIADRLDPEVRVQQNIPIEEMVKAYGFLVDAVRERVSMMGDGVSFSDYTYFYQAIFELVAESVRRYASFQAERVSRDRSEYLAGLTHQMRTPLTALKAQLDLIEMRAGLEGPELSRLKSATSRLTLLVSGVLRLERFKPEEIPVRRERIRVAELIDAIVAEIEFEAIKKGLRLEVLVDRTMWLELDPELFWDALSNLLHNAVKYTKQGFVRLETVSEADSTVFKVIDSGPGIAPELQRHLFEIQPSTSRGGMGIGLSIVHRAITALGGSVDVESRPGHGSVFCLRLPLRDASR